MSPNIQIKMKFPVLCVFLIYFGFTRAVLEKYGPLSFALKMVKCEHSRDLNLDVSGIDVYFYDFQNDIAESFPINEAAQRILDLKDLDKVKKFFMFVGGFKSHINKNTEERVRNAFREFPNSYLIIIDHSAYTNDRQGKKKSYERSVKYVYYIGRQLAQMLVGLHEGGISPKTIHCIGHSLGSQMLAHVGEIFFEATGEKIARITALDPAGPCFSNSLIQEQIRAGVADYVEVYHCNAGGLGTTSVLGDVDFFVNKGGSQPNCGTALIPGIIDSSISAKCNHKTCVTMWTASVTNPEGYKAYKCDKYKHFKGGMCSLNDRAIAGFWNPGNATGVYYFSTEGYDLS
ncbi:inactive pancreatic lipase-related protein 1-like isoform X1 [Spodoptera frugiperda]|uniref:Inactive pancreatic lipase-related protein 1-like isoform X1 n=1 Tax=Spodoptera frugiperda TaxID=7108 RepID=A0A9R0E7E5_SPOFR|nr:inactive pancreatic lipase-related protein 1-like isoform X1 [Spodoptera frugiperda]